MESPPAPGPRTVQPPAPSGGAVYQGGFQQRAGQAVALGGFGSVLAFGGCFCCVLPLASIGMGWAAFTRGRDEMRDIDNGYLPQDTRGMAQVGMILGIASMALGGLMTLVALLGGILSFVGRQPGSY